MTATNNESKDRLSQVQSILEYFNRPSQNQGLETINWDEWKDSIHTEGVVDKIKAKYEKFMKVEYNVESAVSKVGS